MFHIKFEGKYNNVKAFKILNENDNTCTFHTEQQEHGNDGKKSSNGINDDEFKRIVIGNEQNVKNSSRR